MTEQLQISNLYKSFLVEKNNQRLSVLENINLTIEEGEFIAIVGHSGCGKSTLLKIIAGLDVQDRGECLFKEKPIKGPGFERGMIFQEHRLFPWLTIDKNIKLGLDKYPTQKQEELVDFYLKMVKLSEFKHAYPYQLSGGMSQRAAIARALAPNPEVLLLDEPFGALDALTKMELQEEISEIRKKQKNTMIMVTHDIEEAVFLADRVVVMSPRPGIIQKIITIELTGVRDRGSSDVAFYKKKIHDYCFR